MAEVEILNVDGMTINKVISDDIKKVDGTAYITKETCDGLYKPKNNGAVNIKSINYTPAQEQKIQFSLNEPYTIKFAGWFVVNPDDRAAESWFISINDRPMFHSDDDGNMSVSILVYEGDIITSTTEYDRYGYLMPCESELSDWREVKSDADIWKNAVRTDGTFADQWLDNSESSGWQVIHGSTYKSSLKYIKNDEAFDASGNHLFYVQSENIKTGYKMFYMTALASFNGDLSSLTDGSMMFYNTPLQSFNGDLSSLTDGSSMFYGTALASFNCDLPNLTNGYHMFYNCSALKSFRGDLSSLTTVEDMFYGSALASFNGDLSSLTNGFYIFSNCRYLTSFNGNLSSLTDGSSMFVYAPLQTFSGNLSSLTNGYRMFYETPLTSFDGDLSSLTDGESMFSRTSLKSFNCDLPSLTDGIGMFRGCYDLESFKGDLSSLTDGTLMFYSCKLNLESVQNIANSINTVSSGSLRLGVASSLNGNSDLNAALTAIRNKGWTVDVGYNK